MTLAIGVLVLIAVKNMEGALQKPRWLDKQLATDQKLSSFCSEINCKRQSYQRQSGTLKLRLQFLILQQV